MDDSKVELSALLSKAHGLWRMQQSSSRKCRLEATEHIKMLQTAVEKIQAHLSLEDAAASGEELPPA
jgi:hypothetical protein